MRWSISAAWLDDPGITIREHLIRVPGRCRALAVDGYDPATNTLYDFLGDYFHGNPTVYDPNDWISASQRVTFGQRYARLVLKISDLRVAGFQVITMWERDFRAATPGRLYTLRPPRLRRPMPCNRPPRPPGSSQSDLFG